MPSWRAPTARTAVASWIVDVASGEARPLPSVVSLAPTRSPSWLRRQGAGARRPSPAGAEQRGAVVGDHAGGREAWRRRDPGHDLAHHRGAGRPRRARPCAHDRHRRGPGRQVCRPTARRCVFVNTSATPIAGWLPLGDAYKCSADVQARRRDQRRRSAAALFHLGHDGQAQAGAPQPSRLPRGRAVDHVLAGPAAGRRARQHLLAGLGQARLEHLLRAVECRRHRADGQPGAIQRQGAAGRAGALQGHAPSAHRRRCGA